MIAILISALLYSQGCYSLPTDMDKGYPEFGYHLNKTGRPMIYSCSWPVYQTYSGMTVRSKRNCFYKSMSLSLFDRVRFVRLITDFICHYNYVQSEVDR